MPKGSKEIFEEIQAQIADNTKRNEAYFARIENQVKLNENFIRDMQLLKHRDDEVWRQMGLDLDKTYDKNPFLFLEEIAPEAFKGMSVWVERSRQDALKELEFFGFDIQQIKRAKEMRKSIKTSPKSELTSEDIKKSRSKRLVRRVRI